MIPCPKCGTRDKVLRDICIRCSWNVIKERGATTEELEDVQVDVERSIADLMVALDLDYTRSRA